MSSGVKSLAHTFPMVPFFIDMLTFLARST